MEGTWTKVKKDGGSDRQWLNVFEWHEDNEETFSIYFEDIDALIATLQEAKKLKDVQ